MEITTRIVNVAIESFFKKPLLHKEARYDEVAQRCWEAFSSYGLKPTQIVVRFGDLAFNHDLSFMLFNGNGTFKFTSEKVEIHLQNAVNRKDYEVVVDCITKVYEHIPLPEISHTLITASAQTTAASVDAMQQYMMRFANPAKQIVHGGAIVNVLCKGWPQEIRMTVERSLVFPEGIFFTWQTTFPEKKLSRDVLKTLDDACEEAAGKIDLVFAKNQAE
jgi:hypothetical protein